MAFFTATTDAGLSLPSRSALYKGTESSRKISMWARSLAISWSPRNTAPENELRRRAPRNAEDVRLSDAHFDLRFVVVHATNLLARLNNGRWCLSLARSEHLAPGVGHLTNNQRLSGSRIPSTALSCYRTLVSCEIVYSSRDSSRRLGSKLNHLRVLYN